MTSHRPYHHGNLRQAVLDRAAVMLRDRGAADLSLRELASDVGVTHAAPRRYFPDRQALLDALAVEGFVRLGTRLRAAVQAAPGYREQVRSAAAAYLRFATSEANLVELMFAHNRGADGAAVTQGANAAFAPILEMFRRGETEGLLPGRDPERVGLLFVATIQGVAGLINCGMIDADRLDDLAADVAGQVLGPPPSPA